MIKKGIPDSLQELYKWVIDDAEVLYDRIETLRREAMSLQEEIGEAGAEEGTPEYNRVNLLDDEHSELWALQDEVEEILGKLISLSDNYKEVNS